jgi:hypothetical protein
MTANGHSGTAEIKWMYDRECYYAFITVPYQDTKWQNLFVYDKDKLIEATEKAKQYLEIYLSYCTLCM